MLKVVITKEEGGVGIHILWIFVRELVPLWIHSAAVVLIYIFKHGGANLETGGMRMLCDSERIKTLCVCEGRASWRKSIFSWEAPK